MTKAEKIAADRDARAEMILEITQDLQDAVTREAAQLVCAEIDKVQAVLHGASNMLAVISAGYAAGSLPKVRK